MEAIKGIERMKNPEADKIEHLVFYPFYPGKFFPFVKPLNLSVI